MPLFSPCKVGSIDLKNRVVMAPMTRSRAIGNCANPLMAEYYRQRSGAGLIITEGTSPSPNGLGYARIPGLFSSIYEDFWSLVTTEVHAAGGKIFVQLMHCGRVGSCLNLPPEAELVAPSAVPLNGTVWTDSQGEQPYDMPREMTSADISHAIEEYGYAARLAMNAGFDGVEVHGANGYLITQFLDPGSNQRHDDYGGDHFGRNRFAIEVVARVAREIGADKTGVRLSPYGVFNAMSGTYPDIVEQYISLAASLGALHPAYLHMVDHSAMGAPKPDQETVSTICRTFRTAGGGAVVLSGGYDRKRAAADIESGAADLIAFGRPFISNPDLVEKLKTGIPLLPPDQSTFYTSGKEGYTDYP